MIHYAVGLDARRHVVHVTLRCPVAGDRAEFTLPAWSPGSYRIRDHARHVHDVSAEAGGTPLAVVKVDKATWSVELAGATEIVVRYAVYAHDLSVHASHIDESHAFLHGPATFLAPSHLRKAPVELILRAPSEWTITCAVASGPRPSPRASDPHSIATPPARASHAESIAVPRLSPFAADSSSPIALPRVSDVPPRATPGLQSIDLRAANVDELYDSPIHLGLIRTHAVPAKVPVTLSIWGERSPGVFGEQRLVADLAAIVDDHVARFGEAPFAHYTFIVMLAHDGYGGLEHRASSAILYQPHFAATRKAYEGLLELLSHELFHAWNGKRIAPPALLDIDTTREAYTRCLWVTEGLTSHYDRFALRSAGRITAKSLLERILDDWARLQATPGRARHSLEQASFDAWIKLYQPDESNLNTTVSYYLKGGLVMLALDLQIRRRTEGARSLDDVVRLLWRRYGKERVPHPENVQPIFEEATGLALDEFFNAQIRGTADPELAAELLHVGLELRACPDPAQVADGGTPVWLGATVAGNRITGVFDGGPAASASVFDGGAATNRSAGLSPGDEVIAVDGYRVTSDADLRSLVAPRQPGDRVVLSVFRRHRLLEVPVIVGQAPPTRYELVGVGEPGAAARYAAWLGEPHPGVQVMASVTTTARWV